METNQPTTLKQYIKWLRNAVNKGHLYDNEEFYRIKKELRESLKVRDQLSQLEKSEKGFGYTYEPAVNEVTSTPDLSDSRSGEDDGVRSESIEPEQSGEPESSGVA